MNSKYVDMLKEISTFYKEDFMNKFDVIKSEYKNQIIEIKEEFTKFIDEKVDLTIDLNKIQK